MISIITLLSAAFPFLLLPIITRMVSTEDYGNLVIAETLMAVMTPIIQFSISGIFVEFYKLQENEFKKYVSSSLFIALPVFLSSELIVFIFADFLARKFSINSIWLYYLPFIVLLNLIMQILTAIYQCKKSYKSYSFFLIGPSLFSFILTIIFLSVFELGWESSA